MGTVNEAVATFERNIAAQTGRAVQALTKHGQVVAWLKTEHRLSHAHADHVAKQASAAAAPRSVDDPSPGLRTSTRS